MVKALNKIVVHLILVQMAGYVFNFQDILFVNAKMNTQVNIKNLYLIVLQFLFVEGTTCNIVGKKLDEAKKAIKMFKNEKVLRFDKAKDYYNSLRSNSFENCQDICMKDVNCEMSSFLVFFKFCYLYNNTEFRQHNTDYGY